MRVEPTEKQIENSILCYLEHLPECFAWKNQSVGVFDPVKKIHRKSFNRYHINGVSDILGVYKGRFLAIEVKRPSNKKRSPDQDNFIRLIKSQGGLAFYATSVEDVKRELAKVAKDSMEPSVV